MEEPIVCTNCGDEYDPTQMSCPVCGNIQGDEPAALKGYDDWDAAIKDTPGLSLTDQYPDEFEPKTIVELGFAYYEGDLKVWDTQFFELPTTDEVAAIAKAKKDFVDQAEDAGSPIVIAHIWVHNIEEA